MIINNTPDSQFYVERLETRRMLAGNVTARFTAAGDLVVTGDNQSNFIIMDDTGSGVEISGAQGTTVNGGAGVTLSAPTRNLKINLRGGDNTLSLKNTTSQKTILRSGGGEDLFKIRDINAGELRINSGAGGDLLALITSTIGKAGISTARGNDLVTIPQSNIGSAKVRMGADSDVLFSQQSVYQDDFQLKSGSGTDVAVTLSDEFQSDVLIDGGSQNDEILIPPITPATTIGGEYTEIRFDSITAPADFIGFNNAINNRLHRTPRYDDLIFIP